VICISHSPYKSELFPHFSGS